ncbi:ABC transporter [Croceivirga lutea]|uniref:ABC1 kinase family protein n=1 Tax=Croceivirga lutea TaxID=1775167 RepID=UPI00163B5AB8|nr:AarF/UbiB family protein [Croceivirga lutea]GGG57563.1 ABC transporter [Croceivirga lutea]
MKTLDKIPTGKLERAGKLVTTGIKIGGNYAKYYSKKLVNPDLDKEELNQDNATDIYDGLKSLKGSALKVAQMLSMEKNLLPRAYVEKFSLSQFSVPPLSAPLVRKTFKKYFGKYPEEIFDQFDSNSINAASIGQVHKAEKDGKTLAVKIQYPGVAQSISSDLALVKPIALKMFNLPAKDSEKYFKEVEHKLIEETNYILELEQSKEITKACAKIELMRFPGYYPELSSERIITMDWMQGLHLGEFVKTDFDPKVGNKLGQALWNFYMYQIHGLKKVHADPHPGNFLVSDDEYLIAIDFGCIKQIPDDFYIPYFEMADQKCLQNEELFEQKLFELEILTPTDSSEELLFFKNLFKEMLSIFTMPFHYENFDFGNEDFWAKIADLSERYSKDQQIRKMNSNRGSKHFIYMNRTFFGLYNLLYDLNAKVKVNDYQRFLK